MLPTIATGNVGSALAGEYEVDNSLRFDDGSSDTLQKTFSSASNRKTWTWSCWVKRCTLSTTQVIFVGGSPNTWIRFRDNDKLELFAQEDYKLDVITDMVFRDSISWYHICVAVDMTQASQSNRVKIYVNGSLVDVTVAYAVQNFDTGISNNSTHYIGRLNYVAVQYIDMYLAEMVFIDGTQNDVTDFGEFDSDSNIWKPKDVSDLTFGTNGFYLDFEDSSALGNDVSGNNNDWTVNNLTAVDQSTDTCTNNGCTLNPLVQAGSITSGATHTFSNGNLSLTGGTNKWIADYGTFALTTGKWFYEIKLTTFSSPSGSPIRVGWGAINDVVKDNNIYFRGLTYDLQGIVRYGSGGTDGGTTTGRTAFVQGDIVSIAIDIDNDEITFYKNGSVTNVEDFDYSSLTTNIKRSLDFAIAPHIVMYANNSNAVDYNFGSPPYSESGGNSDANGYGNFSMAVPSGYYSLNTKNLAEFG